MNSLLEGILEWLPDISLQSALVVAAVSTVFTLAVMVLVRPNPSKSERRPFGA